MPNDVIEGFEPAPSNERYTQVYLDVHTKEGGAYQRSPIMNNSFITFNFDGKWIDEFGLLASFPNNRLQRAVYSQFEDITSEYEVINGHHYWGSHLKGLGLDFTLVTDGMTQKQLDDFNDFFKPGKIADLFLSEHPNRKISARVSVTPIYAVIPFDEDVIMTLDGTDLVTKTTIYKGEISLSFISESSYWTARYGQILTYYEATIDDKFTTMTETNASGLSNTIEDKDFIKVIYEDNVPHTSMLDNLDDYTVFFQGDEKTANRIEVSGETNLWNLGYYYYSGNAAERPVIKFTITPTFDDTTKLIISPVDENSYNYIQFGNNTDNRLLFILPNLYHSYNDAVNLINSFSNGEAVIDLEIALRAKIYNTYIRRVAVAALGLSEQTQVNATLKTSLVDSLQSAIKETNEIDRTVEITLNFETGEFIGKYNNLVNENSSLTEEVGQMLYKKYFILPSTLHFNTDNKIDINQCSAIITNCSAISAFSLEFKNRYL